MHTTQPIIAQAWPSSSAHRHEPTPQDTYPSVVDWTRPYHSAS